MYGNEFLTVNEAAQALQVSATTVRNWAASGRLTEQRTPGGHRRFRADDVDALARTLRQAGRPTVLVIDDDEAIRFVLSEALGGAGYEVHSASGGLSGLESLDRQAPSLIVLDIMMPGIDGLQVMRLLEQFSVDVPILAVSALGTQIEARAREFGADAYLSKPFDMGELLDTCARLIAGS